MNFKRVYTRACIVLAAPIALFFLVFQGFFMQTGMHPFRWIKAEWIEFKRVIPKMWDAI
jgi:hypothetical protein